jgi:hypothetical protein
VDYLAAEPRVDLYQALLVDAKHKHTAKLLLRAALSDPSITPGQDRDLTLIFADNYGEYGEPVDAERLP